MSRLFAGTPFDIPPKCDDCGQLESECVCTPAEKAASAARRQQEEERQARAAARIAPEKQTAVIRIEKRKGGRKATVITGLTDAANDLPALLKQLQADCGSGGTVKPKDDLLEIQGDHAARVRQTLTAIGYRVKG
ncbi:translation initiation factor [Blastopirellula marina]|uniref:Translation initiation factor n=1 Tax=Blastopirellula marina TaxID=124 RepID=A0A2S8GL87_9BACT|nr:translation initiation factor [Blastopirellula marina]PQO26591.1 translation initiation factor [Blastopirellula marina]PQO45160.1 translation initiation factor [Blastopirellula marina]PTL40902.1 translation initiation factor [Blastopirellula marina]